MKILMILAPIVVGLIAAVAAMGVGGLFISKTHSATRSVTLDKSPQEVWAVITDFQSAPTWRKGLKSVERGPDQSGHPVWREISARGEVMPIEIVESTPPSKLVGRIADPALPFGGTWTYVLTPEAGGAGGCRIRITEDGEIYSPMFRYIARLIGYTATIDGYLKALSARLGSSAPIEP